MESFVFSVLALLFSGVAWFLAARSAKDMPPLVSMFLFQLVGIPFFVFLLPWLPFGSVWPSTSILLIGIYETFVMALMFYAMRIGNVSVVMPVINGYAVVTAILGILFLGEVLSWEKAAGILCVMIGIALVSTQTDKRNAKEVDLKRGALPAFIVAIGTGVYFYLVGIAARTNNWFATVFGIRVAISLTALLLLLMKKEDLRKMWKNVPWKWILPGACLDVLGFSFYNIAVAQTEVSYVTVMISAQSLVTVLLGYYFLKEKIVAKQWMGIVVTIVGLIILQFKSFS